MKKVIVSLAALAALSSAAFAGTAFEKQMKRNMVENPDRYSTTLQSGFAVTGDALAIEDVSDIKGIKRFAGPGEDGRQGR
jgi:hypothetical protein